MLTVGVVRTFQLIALPSFFQPLYGRCFLPLHLSRPPNATVPREWCHGTLLLDLLRPGVGAARLPS